jgi:nucleotide-binding universal stress UspA family protein
MKTIVAPTDFSPSSLNAVNYAADLAAGMQAELVLLNVVQLPVSVSEVPMTENVFEELIDEARESLEDLTRKLISKTGGKIKIAKELVVGSVGRQVEEMCEYKKPFAVVMGMKEGADLGRFLLGSNALSAVRHLHFPVLVVPEHATFHGIARIGLACDTKDLGDSLAVRFLENLMSDFTPEIHIIHICSSEEEESFGKKNSLLPADNPLLKFHPQFHFLPKQQIDAGIGQFASEHKLDFLIVFPKKHDLLEILDKKQAKRIILKTNIPVLSIV